MGAVAVIAARAWHERGAVKVRVLYVDPAVDRPVVDEDVIYAGSCSRAWPMLSAAYTTNEIPKPTNHA